MIECHSPSVTVNLGHRTKMYFITSKPFWVVLVAWLPCLRCAHVMKSVSGADSMDTYRSVVSEGLFSSASRREERALPCPSDVDVAPCVCSFDGASLDLDCSSVKDLDDLARVFQADFPFPSFTSLAIADNPHLVGELPGGIFGPVTFQNITLLRTNLSAVSDKAFASSASRLQLLDLGSNALTSFPFETLGDYFLLQHLDLKRNRLGRILELESSSLEYLKLDSNPLLELTATTFANARYLRALYLNDVSLKGVPVGLFDSLNHLQELYLMGNQIQTLSSGTFNLNSKSLIIVALAGNAISQVEPNAFGKMIIFSTIVATIIPLCIVVLSPSLALIRAD